MADTPTKTVDGADYPASDWAYVPDESSPSTWKLRLTKEPGGSPDASIVGAAIAALGKGFRGNKVAIPAKDRAGVIAKVRAAWKKANPDAKDGDMPAVLKMSEQRFGLYNAKLAKTNPAVQYSETEVPDIQCADCIFFQNASCNLVEGSIKPDAHCNLFTDMDDYQAPGMPMPYADDEPQAEMFSEGIDGWQPFTALEQYAEPPEWIPLLPKPGEYKHSKYGQVNITKQRNEHFMEQFKSGVYQPSLPIDAEHKASDDGAYGWINDMRMNGDGSVDGKAEWSDLGETAIKNNRFKYISPTILNSWEDNYGEKHADIVAGAALTTRPWFKASALRPMVMNEHGTWLAEPSGEADHDVIFTMVQATEPKGGHAVADNTKPASGESSEQQYSEADVQEFRDQIAALTAERDELKGKADANAQQYAEVAAKVEKLEADARTARLEAISAQWFGDHDVHLSTLEAMAQSFGEDSDVFKGYCDQQDKVLAAMKESRLFTEVGTGRGNERGTSALDRMNTLIEQYQEKHDEASYEQAMDAVLLANPNLYREYREEMRSA